MYLLVEVSYVCVPYLLLLSWFLILAQNFGNMRTFWCTLYFCIHFWDLSVRFSEIHILDSFIHFIFVCLLLYFSSFIIFLWGPSVTSYRNPFRTGMNSTDDLLEKCLSGLRMRRTSWTVKQKEWRGYGGLGWGMLSASLPLSLFLSAAGSPVYYFSQWQTFLCAKENIGALALLFIALTLMAPSPKAQNGSVLQQQPGMSRGGPTRPPWAPAGLT